MKRQSVLSFLMGLLSAIAILTSVSYDKINPDEELVEVKPDGRLQYKWYPPEMPRSISFAGEKVPLDRWEVRERLQRELLINYYMHGTTLYEVMLSTRYFPTIESQLRANGIPDDFKYVCVAESAFMHNVSSAGAASLWQLMKPTAQQYGLIVDDDVDERYNPVKATQVACAFLKQAHAKFGSWTSAAASYNCGMGNYNSYSSFQQTSYYYDMQLPEETNRYVYRVLALKYIIGNAKTMGFIVDGKDAYQPVRTRTIPVDYAIPDLAQWAIDHGSNYKMLRLMNPWLRGRSLDAHGGRTFQIALPA